MSLGGFLGGFMPPVVAELKGDIRDFRTKMGEARAELSKTVADGESKMSHYGQVVSRGMLAVGTVILGVGIGLEHLGQKWEQADRQLDTAITNAGKSMTEYQGDIDKAIKKNEKFGHTAADTAEGLAKLTTATQDPKKALDLLGTASELAAVKHISLAGASTLLARAYAGNMRVFREFGINIKDTGDVQKIVTEDTKKNAAAQQTLADATQHLRDVEQLIKQSEQETLADRVALRDATERLGDAEDQAARRTRDAREQLATVEESSARRIADAQEKLAREQQDAQRAISQAQSDYFNAKTPEERVAAEQRLADQQIQSQRRVSDASQGVADAERESQRQMRDAKQNAADSAKENARTLRDAEQSLADVRQRANDRAKVTLRQEIELRDARTRVARASAAARASQTELTTAQNNAAGAASKFDKALALLNDRIKNQAEIRAQTFGGKIDALKAKIEDMAARAGAKWGPAIMGLGGAMQAVGGISSLFRGKVGGLIGAAGGAEGAGASGILGAAGAFGLAVAGGVALGIGLHKLIEQHFPAFDRALEKVGGKVADFLNLGDHLSDKTKAADKVGIFGDMGYFDPQGGYHHYSDPDAKYHSRPKGFALGGIVPGPIGSPQLIEAHGGEEVRTVREQRAAAMNVGGDTYIFNITSNSRREAQRAADEVRKVLLRGKRRNVNAGLA